MQRTTTTARRKMALVASLPFLALGLAACGDDEPVAPPEQESEPSTPDGGGTDGDTGGDTGGDTEGESDGGDTGGDTEGGSDGAGTGGDTEGGSEDDESEGTDGGDTGASADLSEFDNGEGAPGVFTANPGECLDSVATDEIISCDEEHDLEVFYTYNIEADEFPGEDVVSEEAQATCEENFEAYVGSAPEDSEYAMFALSPSQTTWDQAGDTEVICMLESAELTTGSGYQSNG
ncbi:septum formation family protein [Georgenia sp. Z1491]|uniref:septum formation family protein n=1 Tax=Georgenia sp. Z1491 TaxID=3416707 RepID=UPI003CF5BADB